MSNSIKSFKPSKIVITSLSGEEKDITALCPVFQYFENIDNPFVQATLRVIDSGINLIKTLPIQGGEFVKLDMKCAVSETEQDVVSYEFRIWKVYNRTFDAKTQSYSLALLPSEAFTNEYQRVAKLLKGKPSELVEDLLKNYLKTEKEISIETTGNKVVFFPGRRNIVSIIKSLQLKSISQRAYQNSGINSESKTRTVSTENSENDKQIKGTAGYFFFENKKGFTFKSIDQICDNGDYNFGGTAPVATYYAAPVVGTGANEKFFTIERYKFISEIDLIDKMRRGVYSSKLITYNFSTGEYDEYVYSLEDTFENMAKLGNQDKLPRFATSSSENKKLPPSRVMSMVIDHETWNYTDEVADPEQQGKAEFPDESKYLIAQGIARRNTLEFQKLEISIPGNSSLVVGDKIKIYLPNMAAEQIRNTEQWDRESSGNYLISKLSHNYFMSNESGPTFETVLELVRDTYGMEEEPSNLK